MNKQDLKIELINSLEKIYYMEAFSQLVEFLQGELYLLRFLALHRDSEVNPSVLSEKLHMTRPRITATIAALKKKELVSTELDRKDRRRLKVKITKKGVDSIFEKQAIVDANFEEFINGIGEEDAKELIRIVNLAVKIMQKKQVKNEE
ncbi:MAG: MarR family transcriptional regulator [Gudongella sp.]|nr:MarR family transcriptional regulator [Gudongella sp.]